MARSSSIVVALTAAAALACFDADTSQAAAQSSPAASPAATGDAKLEAKLVDPEKKARAREATVEVKVTNLQLIDPASVGEQPSKGQGHLHYQLDDGAVIATPTPKLSFHELKPGNHKIKVVLAGNDHKPLGPQTTLEVTVPSGN